MKSYWLYYYQIVYGKSAEVAQTEGGVLRAVAPPVVRCRWFRVWSEKKKEVKGALRLCHSPLLDIFQRLEEKEEDQRTEENGRTDASGRHRQWNRVRMFACFLFEADYHLHFILFGLKCVYILWQLLIIDQYF